MKVSQRAESNRASGFISPEDNRMPPYVPPELRLVISHRFTVRKLVRPIRPGTPDT